MGRRRRRRRRRDWRRREVEGCHGQERLDWEPCLIVITAAKCDAGVSRFSREASAGIRITAASTTPQCYGRVGQEELNHVTL